MISQALDGATPTGPTLFTEQWRRRAAENNQSSIQVVITGTATIVVEGSLDGVTWFTIDTISAATLKRVDVYAYMRLRRSAGTGSAACIIDIDAVPLA